jgi:uncharacterized protein (TIGR03437 family)
MPRLLSGLAALILCVSIALAADPPCTIRTLVGDPEPFFGDGGPATQASFFALWGIAAAPDGTVYLADAYNRRIRKIDPEGIVTTISGTGQYGFSGDGGPATSATLRLPRALALGPDGSLYFVDWIRVRRIHPDGTIETVAGNGSWEFNGDAGRATETSIQPDGIALDAAGNLFIADGTHHRILKVTPDGQISTIAGSGSGSGGYEGRGFSGDGGPATEARLYNPYGVAVLPDGAIWFTDNGNYRVRRIRADGIIETVAGTGEVVFSQELTAPTPVSEMKFEWLSSIAVDSAGVVHVINSGQLLRFENTTVTPTNVNDAGSISFDAGGQLLYTAPGNHVKRRAPDGVITTIAGRSVPLSLDPAPANRISVSALDLAEAPNGDLYFVSDLNIYRRTPDGTVHRVGGNGQLGDTALGVPATGTSFQCLRAIALDEPGNIYVADMCAHRIFQIDTAGIVSLYAGNGVDHYELADPNSARGQPAVNVPFPHPRKLAVDAAGNVYAVVVRGTYPARIFKVDREGIVDLVAPGLPLDTGSGVANNVLTFDQSGNLYVGLQRDTGIARITPAGDVSTVPGTAGIVDYFESLAFDSTGNLYIDDGRHLHRRSPDGVLTRLTRYAPEETGYGEGGPLWDTITRSSKSLLIDRTGGLVMTDLNYTRVRRISTPGACPGEIRPAVGASGIVNAASMISRTSIAPGEILTLFGANLGPSTPVQGALDEHGKLATEAGDVRVAFGSLPSPILYASAFQASVIVPYAVTGEVDLRVEYNGMASERPPRLKIAEAQPAIFTLDSSGVGQAAVVNSDGTINSPANPAARGSIILIYATGEGLSDPTLEDGEIVGDTLPSPRLPVSVQFEETPGRTLYAGGAPGLVAGALQINAEIPLDAPTGDAVRLEIRVGDHSSRLPGPRSATAVTVAIR